MLSRCDERGSGSPGITEGGGQWMRGEMAGGVGWFREQREQRPPLQDKAWWGQRTSCPQMQEALNCPSLFSTAPAHTAATQQSAKPTPKLLVPGMQNELHRGTERQALEACAIVQGHIRPFKPTKSDIKQIVVILCTRSVHKNALPTNGRQLPFSESSTTEMPPNKSAKK